MSRILCEKCAGEGYPLPKPRFCDECGARADRGVVVADRAAPQRAPVPAPQPDPLPELPPEIDWA